MKFLLTALLIGALVGACHDGCETNDMKCSDNAVLICNGDEDWQTVTDCDDVDPVEWNWICCEEFAACLPQTDCEEMSDD